MTKRRDCRRTAASFELQARAEADDDSPRRITVVASTETPIRSWGVDEVLSHKRGAVDLSRLKTAPVLVDHVNEVDSIAGRVVSAKVSERKLIVEAELLGEVGARIEEKLNTGLLQNVSVGYKVDEWVRTRARGDGQRLEMTATKWRPFELSFVAVGGDPNAQVTGIRSEDEYDFQQEQQEVRNMPDEDKNDKPEAENTPPDENNPPAGGTRAAVVTSNAELYKFADEYKDKVDAPALVRATLEADGGLPELKQRIFDAMDARLDKLVETGGEDTGLGLSRREVDNFSFRKLFHAMAKPNDKSAQADAAFEFDVAHSAAQRFHRETGATGRSDLMIPEDVLRGPICGDRDTAERVVKEMRTRAVNVGTDTAGGHLVAENLMAANYIDILRAESAMLPRATPLPGLVGTYEIPRLTSSVDPSWVEEAPAADTGLSTPTWDRVTLSPKKVVCFTAITHNALIQTTPAAEAIIRMDMAAQEALKIDYAAFVADGTGEEPTGIENQTGVNEVTVASSTNGAALTRDVLIDMRTKIAQANGITGGETFFMNPLVGGKLRKTKNEAEGAAEGFLWDMRTNDRPVIGQMAVETTNIPATGTKGTGTELSTFFFGNPATVFFGTWGGLDVLLDPFTMRRQGQVVISMIRFADIAIRQPKQFSIIKNVVGNK